MALFTKSELTQGFQKRARDESALRSKTASQVLMEETQRFTPSARYTIFLSHSFRDANIILELKRSLESLGYSVYVDWLDDPQLDRSHVTKQTATLLRQRMLACDCLFYATTDNSSSSKWMPWECGFVDGKKDKAAILPIVDVHTEEYIGQEYLSLYPYVSKATLQNTSNTKLWINESPTIYVLFDNWLKGEKPTRR